MPPFLFGKVLNTEKMAELPVLDVILQKRGISHGSLDFHRHKQTLSVVLTVEQAH